MVLLFVSGMMSADKANCFAPYFFKGFEFMSLIISIKKPRKYEAFRGLKINKCLFLKLNVQQETTVGN